MANLILKECELQSSYSGLLTDFLNHPGREFAVVWYGSGYRYAYWENGKVYIKRASSLTATPVSTATITIAHQPSTIICRYAYGYIMVAFSDDWAWHVFMATHNDPDTLSHYTYIEPYTIDYIVDVVFGASFYIIGHYVDTSTNKGYLFAREFSNSWNMTLETYNSTSRGITARGYYNSPYYTGYSKDPSGTLTQWQVHDGYPRSFAYTSDTLPGATSFGSGHLANFVHYSYSSSYYAEYNYVFSEVGWWTDATGEWKYSSLSGDLCSYTPQAEETFYVNQSFGGPAVVAMGDGIFDITEGGDLLRVNVKKKSSWNTIVAIEDYMLIYNSDTSALEVYRYTWTEFSGAVVTAEITNLEGLKAGRMVIEWLQPPRDYQGIFVQDLFRGYVTHSEKKGALYRWELVSSVQRDLEKRITVSYISKKASEILEDLVRYHCDRFNYDLTGTNHITATTTTYTVSFNSKLREIFLWLENIEGMRVTWDPTTYEIYYDVFDQRTAITLDDSNLYLETPLTKLPYTIQRVTLYGAGTLTSTQIAGAGDYQIYDWYPTITDQTQLDTLAAQILTDSENALSRLKPILYKHVPFQNAQRITLTISKLGITAETWYIERQQYNPLTKANRLWLTNRLPVHRPVLTNSQNQYMQDLAKLVMYRIDMEYHLPEGATQSDLEDAISTVGAAGGGTIYLPRGTITITSTITFNYDNITIIGHGQASVLDGTVSSGYVLDLNNKTVITLKHFKITMDNASLTSGIHVYGSYHTLEELWVAGDVGDDETNSTYAVRIDGYHNTLRGLHIYNVKYGLYTYQAYYTTGTGLHFYNCGTHGLSVHLSSYNHFSDMTFYSMGGASTTGDVTWVYVVGTSGTISQLNSFKGISGYFAGGATKYKYYFTFYTKYNYVVACVGGGTAYDGGTGNTVL